MPASCAPIDEARKRTRIKLLVGARLVTIDGFEALAYPTDRAAYGRLCRLLTAGNLKAKKGECHLAFDDILGASEGQMLIAMPPRGPAPPSSPSGSPRLAEPRRAALFSPALHHYRGDEPRRLGLLAELGERARRAARRRQRRALSRAGAPPLADVLTCIREKCTIAEAGFRLEANAERH